MTAWARFTAGVFSRFAMSPLHAARPEPLGLIIAVAASLGGTWMFLGITEDVVSSDPLVQFDLIVFTALQSLRTGWLDKVMFAATELGSALVAVCVVVAVSVVLVRKRCWLTLAYWLTAVGFAQALVWILNKA